MSYVSLDEAVQLILQLGKCTLFARVDLNSYVLLGAGIPYLLHRAGINLLG